MLGLKVKYLGQEYNIGSSEEIITILISLTSDERFIIEGGSSVPYISSFQKAKVFQEIEFEVVELKSISAPLSEDKNPNFIIDSEFTQLIFDSEWRNNCKLKSFRTIEAILKEEGVI